MKKFFLPATIIATLVVVIGGIFLISKSQKSSPVPTPAPNTYEYFWGDGCPHCAKVEEFMNSWDKKDKIKLTKMEVWKNLDNARIMDARAKACGIPKDQLGVPLLYTPDGKCLIGDGPIIDLFKSL